MYRRGTVERNDTPLIIGNLPKRLQEKIITRGNLCTRKGAKSTSADGSAFGKILASNEQNASTAGANVELLTSAFNGDDDDVQAIDSTGSPQPDVRQKHAVLTSNHNVVFNVGKPSKKQLDSIPGSNARGIIHLKAGYTGMLMNADAVSSYSTYSSKIAGGEQKDNTLSPTRQILTSVSIPWFEGVAEHYVKKLPVLHENLLNLMNYNQIIKEWSKFELIHAQLLQIFHKLMLDKIKFCCEQKVDTFFWKILFYNIREYLQEKFQKSLTPTYILLLIDIGVNFYQNLYKALTIKYYHKQQQQHQQLHSQKSELVVNVMLQNLLICLGDLCRYKTKEQHSQDYSDAEKFYHQARALIPSNGVPYNQLAILAIYSRKKFDAVYYHMRSLMASNPIHSSRESLLILFDEIRKKYEDSELLRSSPNRQQTKSKNHSTNSKSTRTEVWVYEDGLHQWHRTECETDFQKLVTNEEHKHLMKFSPEEILRQSTSLYLYVIGKFYTGIGMETVQEHQRKFFMQLNILLKNEKLFISRNRLLKMVALNIFVLESNLNKEVHRIYYVLNFCNQMFGLMIRKANELFQIVNEFEDEEDLIENQSFIDLNSLLQFIKIYFIWLNLRINMWNSIKSKEYSILDCGFELKVLQEFFNCMKCNQQLHQISSNLINGKINFEEDTILAGFKPLNKKLHKSSSINNKMSLSDEILQFKGRLLQLLKFESLLAFNELAYFLIDNDGDRDDDGGEDQQNSSIINDNLNEYDLLDEMVEEDEDANDRLMTSPTNQDTVEIESEINSIKLHNEDSDKDGVEQSCYQDVAQLTKLKKKLEAKNQAKLLYRNKLRELLKYVDTKVYIEVRPKYLLPDTNCFIDYLPEFKHLIKEFKQYILIVPLTVVKELDGLSKGFKLDHLDGGRQKHRIHHYDDVSTRAKNSLDFIKSAKNNIKCATTKGSIINPSLFALVEEEHVSNDDKILATAMALSRTMSSETSKDGKYFIHTELVLITIDRNLRVKALSRNLAVSELTEFLKWAQDCSTAVNKSNS